MKRLLECSMLLRMYTLLMAALYSYTQLNRPETLMYKVAHVDQATVYVAWVLGMFALLGLIDLVVNDLMPDKFVLLQAIRDRHLVMMGIPICFAFQMYAVVRHNFPLILLAYYGVYVILVPASALSDILKRQKRKVCL